MSDSSVSDKPDINADNIRTLAKVIKEHAEQFSLNNWVCYSGGDYGRTDEIPSPLTDCGTVCCICGFANTLAGTIGRDGVGIRYDSIGDASRFLGLPYFFARELFVPPKLQEGSLYERISCKNNPWRQAAELKLISPYVDIYALPAETVADVLDAIADGRITPQ